MKIDVDLKLTKKQIAKWYLLGLLVFANIGALMLGLIAERPDGEEWVPFVILMLIEFGAMAIWALCVLDE